MTKGIDVGVNVLNGYTHSVSRHLAYQKLIDFYKNGFIDAVNKNPLLKSNDFGYMKEHLKGILYPEIANSKTAKTITKVRNNLYQSMLWNNFKAAMQNTVQKKTTEFFISKDAQKITNKSAIAIT